MNKFWSNYSGLILTEINFENKIELNKLSPELCKAILSCIRTNENPFFNGKKINLNWSISSVG